MSNVYLDGVVCHMKLFRKAFWKETFWQYLQMRENIFKGQFIMNKKQASDFLDLYEVAHKAAVLYKLLNK